MKNTMMARDSRTQGFTMVEILIAIGIVVILAGILLSVLSASRRKTNEAVCINQLRQIGAAFRMYMADYEEHRPPRIHHLWPSYVSDKRLFVCPLDFWVHQGGWAWSAWGYENTPPEIWPFPISYGYFFTTNYLDRIWEAAQKQPGRPGYLVCVLHGQPHDSPSSSAHAPYFAGRTLRLCFDGSVVGRDIRFRKGVKFSVWKVMTDQDERPTLQ